MFSVECHCGNLALTASRAPASMTNCNCSICHRLGALWAYYDRNDVELHGAGEPADTYRWGEKTITYHRCGRCGCTTHYTATKKDGSELIALNCRMAPEAQTAAIRVRRFDGLDSWRYLDD